MAEQLTFTKEEVLAEIEKQQARKKSWGSNLLILVISLVIFFQLGLFESSLVDILIIIVVLLVHEAGHFIGMRQFGYRNVQMFFIPFFGAAVAGQSQNVSASKKAIVSLLGPVPGVLLGIILLFVYAFTRTPICLKFAMMLVIINSFNLLPFFPLDGGRVLHDVLFSRNRYIELFFKILAALALIGVGLLLEAWLLAIFGLANLLTLAIPFKLARIATDVRRSLAAEATANAEPNSIDPGQGPPIVQFLAAQSTQPLSPEPLTQSTPDTTNTGDSPTIPPHIAQEIIDRVCRRFSPSTSLNSVANFTKDIWERIHARPPGIGATIALLFGYILCFILSLAATLGLAAVSMLGSNAFVESKIVEYRDGQGRLLKKEQVYVRGNLAVENEVDPNEMLYHGKTVGYDYDGSITHEGIWHHGRKDGQWKEYDSEGMLISVTTFDKGKFVSRKQLENDRWVEENWDDLSDGQREMFTNDMEGPPRGPEPAEMPPAESD
jgi:Zn-dependent protease